MNMFLPQQKDKDGGKMKALNNVFWAVQGLKCYT